MTTAQQQWLLKAGQQAKRMNFESKFDLKDGPPCGPAFSCDDGIYECWFCGRPPHAECTAYYGDDE